MERISSRQNALAKRFRDLARTSGADGVVLLDGAHLLMEALSARTPVDVAAFAEPLLPAMADLVRRTQAAGIRVVAVTPQVLAAISPVRQPSGVVAIARLQPASIEDALRGGPQLIPILVQVQDPGNVGGAIRAAEGCGATALLTTPGSASPLGWKALRAAMGSTLRLPVASNVTAAGLVSELRRRKVALAAAVPSGGTPLPRFDLTGPTAILLGGEGAGVPDEWLGEADARLTIPMKPPVESLNVSIAASLILYEAARQRGN